MYERSYGSKYKETQGETYLGTAEIAALVRADIKAAVKAGDLPKDLKISVTSESYSMGRSIDVSVDFHASLWQKCPGHVVGSKIEHESGGYSALSCGHDRFGHGDEHPDVLNPEGQRVKAFLQKIHGAYNYDGSEVQVDYFDVNYYGQVKLVDEDWQKHVDSERARKAKARLDAPRKKEVLDLIMSKSRGYKRGRLRNVSLERLEALLASLVEKEGASS